MSWKEQKAEAIRKIEVWAKPIHERGERARAEKKEHDPDGGLTRGDWWAVTVLPGPLMWMYVAVVERKQRKAGL